MPPRNGESVAARKARLYPTGAWQEFVAYRKWLAVEKGWNDREANRIADAAYAADGPGMGEPEFMAYWKSLALPKSAKSREVRLKRLAELAGMANAGEGSTVAKPATIVHGGDADAGPVPKPAAGPALPPPPAGKPAATGKPAAAASGGGGSGKASHEFETRADFKDLIAAGQGRQANELEMLRWTMANSLVPLDEIDPEGVPCTGAVTLLYLARRSDVDLSEFVLKLFPKTIPNRSKLDREDDLSDDRDADQLLSDWKQYAAEAGSESADNSPAEHRPDSATDAFLPPDSEGFGGEHRVPAGTFAASED